MITDEDLTPGLWRFLETRTKSQLIEGFMEALDHMQASNTRTKCFCVFSGFGWKEYEEGKWRYNSSENVQQPQTNFSELIEEVIKTSKTVTRHQAYMDEYPTDKGSSKYHQQLEKDFEKAKKKLVDTIAKEK